MNESFVSWKLLNDSSGEWRIFAHENINVSNLAFQIANNC